MNIHNLTAMYVNALPSRNTIVRHWSRFIYLGVASYGLVSMVLGIINNNRLQLYTGLALFISNVLGYYALTDLQQLEQLVSDLNTRIKQLEEDIAKLTELKEELQKLLENIQQEKEEYKEIIALYKQNMKELTQLNEKIAKHTQQLPEIDKTLGNFERLSSNVQTLSHQVGKQVRQLWQTKENIVKETQAAALKQDKKKQELLEQKKDMEASKEALLITLDQLEAKIQKLQEYQHKTQISHQLLEKHLQFYKEANIKHQNNNKVGQELAGEFRAANQELADLIESVEKLKFSHLLSPFALKKGRKNNLPYPRVKERT